MFCFLKEQLIETPVGLSLGVAFLLLFVFSADPSWPPARSDLVGCSTLVILGSGIGAVAMGTWGFSILMMGSMGMNASRGGGRGRGGGSLWFSDGEVTRRKWEGGVVVSWSAVIRHHKLGGGVA